MKIVIEFDPATGAVNINTNVNHKILAYGMLETAKEIIDEYFKKNMSVVKPASMADLTGLNGGTKRT